jgi:2-polyprenyl-3-methyl-5-hydroxy-6-metoxy-1,4-benzoquinol methylase
MGFFNRLLVSAPAAAGGDVPVEKLVWENEYKTGEWDFLGELDEGPRYSVIAHYCGGLKPGGSILDIGCGEGILFGRLASRCRYVGIDISEEAIARASARAGGNAEFIAADAAVYTPRDFFDVIIFNEVLYYFFHPVTDFERCASWLKPDGIAITSLYLPSARADSIRKALKKTFPCISEITIANGEKSWAVSVFKRKPH